MCFLAALMHSNAAVMRWPICTQVPAHDQLAYLNTDAIHDVLKAPGIHVEALPFTHTKSPERWKNVSCCLQHFP